MKNIGIFTWFNSINYGTCLQAYALYKFLKNHNYNSYFIENLKYYYGMHNPIESIMAIVRKCKNKNFKYEKNTIQDFSNKKQTIFKQRKVKNHQFIYDNCSVRINKTKSDYETMLFDTDIFITGSDQIWNPNYLSPINLLSFAKNNKKIAYASSIGVDRIPFLKKSIYKKYLSRFNKIGVREKTAQIELSKLLNKEVVTVLDPTFLLNKDEWSKIIDNKYETLPKKKYIFCYFIGEDRNWEKQVKDFADRNGYEVICAISETYTIPEIGISKPELGVEEFMNYLINADIIATDSFHAVALSINFNKKFVVFKRFRDSDKKSQNSRIVDVLSTFKLEKQLVEKNNTMEKVLNNNIDYSETNNILSELRKLSEIFLINAIEE